MFSISAWDRSPGLRCLGYQLELAVGNRAVHWTSATIYFWAPISARPHLVVMVVRAGIRHLAVSSIMVGHVLGRAHPVQVEVRDHTTPLGPAMTALAGVFPVVTSGSSPGTMLDQYSSCHYPQFSSGVRVHQIFGHPSRQRGLSAASQTQSRWATNLTGTGLSGNTGAYSRPTPHCPAHHPIPTTTHPPHLFALLHGTWASGQLDLLCSVVAGR